MPASSAPDQVRIPLLARLKVGTKLMLLVLLPVGVLLGFTTMTAVAIEAAQRERVDVAGSLAAPAEQAAADQMTATSRWATLAGAERPATWPRRPPAASSRRARPTCATWACRSRCWRWSSFSGWWCGVRSPGPSARSPTGRGPCPVATWTST